MAITVRVALPLYQTVATLLVAYVLLFLPRAIVALRASLAQVPVELEQAAVALGRPPLVAALGTTLRLAAPGHRRRHGARRHGHHHRAHRDADAERRSAPRRSPPSSGRAPASSTTSAPRPIALAMVLLSLPLCVILHRQAIGAIGR